MGERSTYSDIYGRYPPTSYQVYTFIMIGGTSIEMLQAVCFDLDGTLFDDRQYVRAGLANAASVLEAETGVDLSEELQAAYFDRDIRERTFDTVLAENDIPQRHVSKLVDAYHENDGELSLYPGVADTLSTLSDSHNLGLITGGRNGADKVVRLGIGAYFDTVLVTNDRPYSKRDPEPFETVLETLDVSPHEAAYVGDRPGLDFLQPNRLGMDTIRVRTGQYADVEAIGAAKPDLTIPEVRELPGMLAETH